MVVDFRRQYIRRIKYLAADLYSLSNDSLCRASPFGHQVDMLWSFHPRASKGFDRKTLAVAPETLHINKQYRRTSLVAIHTQPPRGSLRLGRVLAWEAWVMVIMVWSSPTNKISRIAKFNYETELMGIAYRKSSTGVLQW